MRTVHNLQASEVGPRRRQAAVSEVGPRQLQVIGTRCEANLQASEINL
jgi:hypothetical protein